MNEEIYSMIEEWKLVYELANQRPAPEVSWEYGWFTIHNGGYVSKHRKRKFQDMIVSLRGRIKGKGDKK